jgi:hypothetical protein
MIDLLDENIIKSLDKPDFFQENGFTCISKKGENVWAGKSNMQIDTCDYKKLDVNGCSWKVNWEQHQADANRAFHQEIKISVDSKDKVFDFSLVKKELSPIQQILGLFKQTTSKNFYSYTGSKILNKELETQLSQIKDHYFSIIGTKNQISCHFVGDFYSKNDLPIILRCIDSFLT